MGKKLLQDQYGRNISYLRISITERCNYRCIYCAPYNKPCGRPLNGIPKKLLSFDEITSIVRVAAQSGISKIRFTGGEPLVRKNLHELIASISPIPGLTEITLTTNGSLLTRQMAYSLKKAGLHRINISLDTLDPGRFGQITGGDIKDVYRGIAAAKRAGLFPIKLNMVISAATSQSELGSMRDFAGRHNLQLQTIAEFSLKKRNKNSISDRPPACNQCNRLRLTCDGYLLPCLFSNNEFKVDFQNIKASFRAAVLGKPHSGKSCSNRRMMAIGG